jgi:phosphatidate cytidylyltransferase
MIPAVLAVTVTAFAIGGAGLLLASRRADAATRRARLVKLITYFAIVHLVLLAAWWGRPALTALFAGIGASGAYELRRGLSSVGPRLRWTAAVVYAILAAGLIVFGWRSTPDAAVYVYLVVAAFDGFSQVAGQAFGRRLLTPRISPGKTLEGSLGGAVAAVVMAVSLRRLAGLTPAHALVLGAALVLASLAGDLAASWLKRRCGLKDFGLLLPGHGGVLDRFDSLLVAAPVWLLLGGVRS